MSSVRDVCRLCLSTYSLVWIFDKRIQSPENMKKIIFITTGVEIAHQDFIAQKICSKCCQITLKMFKFRSTALRNDKNLKTKYEELVKSNKIKVSPSTELTVSPQTKVSPPIEVKVSIPTEIKIKKEKLDAKPPPEDRKVIVKLPVIHHSVSKVLKVHPNMKLPTACLEHNVLPRILLEPPSFVERYLRKQKKRLKILARRNAAQPSNDIRKYLIEVPKKGENRDTKSSRTEIVRRVAKKKTAAKFKNHKDNTEHLRILTSTTSKTDVDKLKKDDISEPPAKTMKLVKKKPIKNSVESVPASPVRGETQSLTNVEKSHELLMCEICNSLHYSRGALKLHQRKHLRCHFCKLYLRSLSARDSHLEECTIRKTMFDLPQIDLVRLEHDSELQNKYPKALKSIRRLSKTQTKEAKTPKTSSPIPFIKELPTQLATIKEINEIANGIIAQLTDEDTSISQPQIPHPETTARLKIPLQHEQILPTKDAVNTTQLASCEASPPHTSVSDSKIAKKKSPISKESTYNTAQSDIATNKENKTCNANLQNTDEEKVESCSIIKPDIKIKNMTMVTNVEGCEIQIMKEILKSIKQNALKDSHKNLQTNLPVNEAIFTNVHDKTCDFNNLKPHLLAYKLSVKIRYANVFNAQYNNLQIPSKHVRQNYHWHSLRPIDFNEKTSNLLANIPGGNTQIQRDVDSITTPAVSSIPEPATTNTSEDSRTLLQYLHPLYNSNSLPVLLAITASSANNVIPVNNQPYATNTLHNVPPSNKNSLSNTNTPQVSKNPIILNGLLPVTATNYNPTPINNSHTFIVSNTSNLKTTSSLSNALPSLSPIITNVYSNFSDTFEDSSNKNNRCVPFLNGSPQLNNNPDVLLAGAPKASETTTCNFLHEPDHNSTSLQVTPTDMAVTPLNLITNTPQTTKELDSVQKLPLVRVKNLAELM